ncbi:hypothetical protein ACFWAY_39205 [Rhodococcus sp. NPDC059968]|uniref:hypothetical protein n=1 Tax=Rhodococcus sp. NPDC059968 TaxID=3347017 RepID=UPI00366CC8FD
MRLKTVVLAVGRMNYAAVRFPLQLIEDTAMSRLDQRAPLRLAYESLLATADGAAERLLGDEPAGARDAVLREGATVVPIQSAARRRHNERMRAAGGSADKRTAAEKARTRAADEKRRVQRPAAQRAKIAKERKERAARRCRPAGGLVIPQRTSIGLGRA